VQAGLFMMRLPLCIDKFIFIYYIFYMHELSFTLKIITGGRCKWLSKPAPAAPGRQRYGNTSDGNRIASVTEPSGIKSALISRRKQVRYPYQGLPNRALRMNDFASPLNVSVAAVEGECQRILAAAKSPYGVEADVVRIFVESSSVRVIETRIPMSLDDTIACSARSYHVSSS
jgi:hypothetical protein